MADTKRNLHVYDNGFVFDSQGGLTYNLNQTGMFILRQLLAGTPPAEITRMLENKYQISRKVATSDLDDFLQQLSSLKLLPFDGDSG